MTEQSRNVDASRIDQSISMLEQYLDTKEIGPLLSVLHELAKKPDDGVLLERLPEILDDLGILQGAVLTYAPYIVTLLSDDPLSSLG